MTIARNAARPTGSWVAFSRPERQLPIGIFGGTTPIQRWNDDVIHRNTCPRSCNCGSNRKGAHGSECKRCQGCRPVAERVEILDERLRADAHRFLLASEEVK